MITLHPSSGEKIFCPWFQQHWQDAPDRAGKAAKEGTRLHALATQALLLGACGEGVRGVVELEHNDLVSFAMKAVGELGFGKKKMKKVAMERRLTAKYRGFEFDGTPDLTLLMDDTLFIVDYKFGEYPVPAKDNVQLELYAWMWLMNHKGDIRDVRKVQTMIIQPKLNKVNTEIYERQQFRDRIEQVLGRIAAESGDSCRRGNYCHFCPLINGCPSVFEDLGELADPAKASDSVPAKKMAAPTEEEITRMKLFKQYSKTLIDEFEARLMEAMAGGAEFHGVRKTFRNITAINDKFRNDIIHTLVREGKLSYLAVTKLADFAKEYPQWVTKKQTAAYLTYK